MQFKIHFQAKNEGISRNEKAKQVIGGLVAKIKKKEAPQPSKPAQQEPQVVDKFELFESKHVKSIIETFNNVLEIMEAQEKELKHFIMESNQEQDSSSDEGDGPKVFKARIKKAEPSALSVATSSTSKEESKEEPMSPFYKEMERIVQEKVKK